MTVPGFSDPTVGPAGDGTFSVSISSAGVVSLAGYTADNTYGVQTSQISFAGYYPLYVPLYQNGAGGSLIGWINFTGDLPNSVSSDSSVTWFDDSAATTLYSGGFTNQSTPLASLYSSTVGDLLSFSSGTVILSGGNLSAPITNAVSISSNVIYVDPSATNQLSLTMNRTTGEIQGSFVDSGVTNTVDGLILQSTNVARGYFLGTSQGGSFILFGD
jgi:hypothetical protein